MTNALHNNTKISSVKERQEKYIPLSVLKIDNLSPSIIPISTKNQSVYLEEKQVIRLCSDLKKNIAISCKGVLTFSLTLEEFVAKLYDEAEQNEQNKDCFIIGSKASDYVDETEHSNDIDIQFKLPEYTDIRELMRLCRRMQALFVEKTGFSEQELYDHGIFKISKVSQQKDRFVILTFSDTVGMKYDVTLVSRLARDFLFLHDARRLCIKSLFNKGQLNSKTKIQLIDPLDNKKWAASCRRNRKLRTINSETINFQGCLRLFSYYVKGWSCREKSLESKLVKGFVDHYVKGGHAAFERYLTNDLMNHHQGCYGAGVVFVFNLLATLARYGHHKLCEELHGTCLKVVSQLYPEALTEALSTVESAVLTDVSAIIGLASTLQINSWKENQKKGISFISAPISNYFLLFGKEEKGAAITIKEKPIPVASIKKELIEYRKPHSHTEWIQQLNAGYASWDKKTLQEYIEKLTGYLEVNRDLSQPVTMLLTQHGCQLLRKVLEDIEESWIVLTFCYALLKAKIPLYEEVLFLTPLRQQWMKGLGCLRTTPVVLRAIKGKFFSEDEALTIEWIRFLLITNLEEEAIKCIESLPQNQVPGDIRFQYIEKVKGENPFRALELFSEYRQLIEGGRNDAVQLSVRNLAEEQLQLRSLSSNQLSVLMHVGMQYAFKGGNFWLVWFEKALQMKKTGKKAILFFINNQEFLKTACVNVRDFLECWKCVVHKVRETHDWHIKSLIACSKYFVELREEGNEQTINKITRSLCQECLYYLKKNAAAKEDYQLFFAFLMDNIDGKEETVSFVQSYILSPINEHFLAACQLLILKNLDLGLDEMIKVCTQIGNRKDVDRFVIANAMKNIVETAVQGLGPKEHFEMVINIASRFPLLKDLINPCATSYMKFELDYGNPEKLAEKTQEFIKAIRLLLKHKNAYELLDQAHFLVAFASAIANENEGIKRCWYFLVYKYLESALNKPTDCDKLVKALTFFFENFTSTSSNAAQSIVFLQQVAEVLTHLFKLDLYKFNEQKHLFFMFFSEEIRWLNLSRPLKRDGSFPINDIRHFQYLSKTYTSVSAASLCGSQQIYQTAVRQYQPPSAEYWLTLKSSLMSNPNQWILFSYGFSSLCKLLLETAPLGKEQEELILELTAKGLEILMLGEFIFSKGNGKSYALNRCKHLLHLYIQRTGVASKDLYTTQLENGAYLYACALRYKNIECASKESLRYLINFELKLPMGVWTESNINDEIPLSIQEVIKNGNVYQLMRLIHVILNNERPQNVNPSIYRKRYIDPLIAACEKYDNEYVDFDGENVGVYMQMLLKQLCMRSY